MKRDDEGGEEPIILQRARNLSVSFRSTLEMNELQKRTMRGYKASSASWLALQVNTGCRTPTLTRKNTQRKRWAVRESHPLNKAPCSKSAGFFTVLWSPWWALVFLPPPSLGHPSSNTSASCLHVCGVSCHSLNILFFKLYYKDFPHGSQMLHVRGRRKHGKGTEIHPSKQKTSICTWR